jgi:hypothetical protein
VLGYLLRNLMANLLLGRARLVGVLQPDQSRQHLKGANTGKILRYPNHMRSGALRFVIAALLLAQVNTLVAVSLHRHEAELVPVRSIAHACIPGAHLSATLQPETYCPACEAIRHSVGLIIPTVTAPAPTVMEAFLPRSRTHRIDLVSHFAAGSRAPPLS